MISTNRKFVPFLYLFGLFIAAFFFLHGFGGVHQAKAASVTISGTLFQDDGTTTLSVADTVKLSVAGATASSATSSAGAWTFSITKPATGAIITVWISGDASNKGSIVFQYGTTCPAGSGGNCTSIPIQKDTVTLADYGGGASFTNTTLATCDNDSGTGCTTTDIGFTSNAGVFTTTYATNMLSIAKGTYAPGGAVNVQKMEIVTGATYSGTSTLTLSGTGTNTTCGNPTTQMPLCNSSGSGSNFTSTTTSFTGTTAAVTIQAGGTLWSYQTLNIGTTADANSQTFTVTGNVTVSGVLTVGAATGTGVHTLNYSSGTLTLSGSGTPFVINSFGAFTAGTSTVTYSNASITTIANVTYSNLTISGTVSTGTQTFTVGGVFTISGTFTPTGGTVTFNNGASIAGAGTKTFQAVTLASSATVTSSVSYNLNSTLTVPSTSTFDSSGGGTVTVNNAAFAIAASAGTIKFSSLTWNAIPSSQPAADFSVAGTLTVNSGQLFQPSGTVTMLGGSTINFVEPSTFANLTTSCSGAQSITANTNFSVTGVLTNGANCTLAPTSGTITFKNGSSIVNSGTLTFFNVTLATSSTVTSSSSFNLGGGIWTIPSTSTFDASGGGTATLNNAAFTFAASPGTIKFSSLTVAATPTSQPSASFSVAATLTVSTSITFSPSGTVTLSSTGTPLSLSGTFSPSGTVTYTGNGATVTCTNATYTNLNLAPSSTLPQQICAASNQTLTVTSNLTIGDGTHAGADATLGTTEPTINITGGLTVSAGATFVSTSGALTIHGDFTNNGTFTANSGTFIFTPTSTSQLLGTTATTTFYNLETSGASGKTIKFKAGNTYVATNAFLMGGDSLGQLTIESTVTSSQWLVNRTGAASANYAVTYVTLQDSGCAAGSGNITLDVNSVDNGNNGTCWVFTPPNLNQHDYAFYQNLDSTSTNAITVNPSSSFDGTVSTAVDSTNGYVYIAGYDASPGSTNEEWRIEKRSTTDGSLVSAFGTSGVVTSNPSTNHDEITYMALDASGGNIYLVGYDTTPGNNEWRIEKRATSNGALVSAFGTSGVVTENPSTGADIPNYISLDATNGYIYISGIDFSPGNNEWRIEKRLTTDGSLVSAFGTSGILTENPSAGDDSVSYSALDVSNGYIYLAGYDNVPGNDEWRIEKRSTTDGSLVSAFGTSGILTENPSTGADDIFNMALDVTNGYIYLGGLDVSPGNNEWRIEKRATSNGAVVSAFGTSGILTENPSSGDDSISDMALDVTNGYLYLGGYDSIASDGEWRAEKRSTTDGTLVTAFGSSGIVTENPNTGFDDITSLALDSANGYIYFSGYDATSGGDAEWRFEKRRTLDANSPSFVASGSPQNVAATLTSTGQAFRLKILLQNTGSTLVSSKAFKLQFAPVGAGCASATYADVTGVSAIAYFNNPTPANGATAVASAGDPTNSFTINEETYVEGNNFSPSANLTNNQDGLWDFSLFDNGATGSATYCFKVVNSDGTAINTYTQYPQITIAASTANITISGGLYQSDGTSTLNAADNIKIAIGAATSYTGTASAVNGTFSVGSITKPSTGTIITIWLNGNTDKGSLVFRYSQTSCNGSGSANCTSLKIIQNNVSVASFDGSNLTNSNLSACDNDSGTVCGATPNTDIGFTSNNGIMTLTYATNTLNVASGTYTPGGDISAQSMTVAGTYTGSNENVNLSSGLTISSGGTMTAPKYVSVAGDFTNNGTYTANNGSLYINPSGSTSQIIGTSATTFYNLITQVSTAKTLKFKAGNTYTISNVLALSGSSAANLTVQSTTASSQWTLNLTGGSSVAHLSVSDSGCAGGSHSVYSDSSTSVSNNGACWLLFVLTGGGGSASSPVGGSGNGGGTPTTGGTNNGGSSTGSP